MFGTSTLQDRPFPLFLRAQVSGGWGTWLVPGLNLQGTPGGFAPGVNSAAIIRYSGTAAKGVMPAG